MGHAGYDKEGHPALFSVLMPALGFVWASGTQAQPSGGWAPPGILPWGLGAACHGRRSFADGDGGAGSGPQDVEMTGCWDAHTESTPHTCPRGSQARGEGGPEGLSRVVRVPWGRRAGGLQGGLALSRRGLRGAGGHPVFSGCLGGSHIWGRGDPHRAWGGLMRGLGHPRSAGAPLLPFAPSFWACDRREKPVRRPERRLHAHMPGASPPRAL